MAKQTTLVSDLTGDEIANGNHARISIRVGDVVYVGEANASEVSFLENLRTQKPRGRKPAKSKK